MAWYYRQSSNTTAVQQCTHRPWAVHVSHANHLKGYRAISAGIFQLQYLAALQGQWFQSTCRHVYHVYFKGDKTVLPTLPQDLYNYFWLLWSQWPWAQTDILNHFDVISLLLTGWKALICFGLFLLQAVWLGAEQWCMIILFSHINLNIKNLMFRYFGHGTGREFLQGDNIQRLDCQAVTLLMGCSSGKLTVSEVMYCTNEYVWYHHGKLQACTCNSAKTELNYISYIFSPLQLENTMKYTFNI